MCFQHNIYVMYKRIFKQSLVLALILPIEENSRPLKTSKSSCNHKALKSFCKEKKYLSSTITMSQYPRFRGIAVVALKSKSYETLSAV